MLRDFLRKVWRRGNHRELSEAQPAAAQDAAAEGGGKQRERELICDAHRVVCPPVWGTLATGVRSA